MPFNVRLCFSGIVGFVPNKEFAAGAEKVGVLIPDGRSPKTIVGDAADGLTKLRRHMAYFVAKAQHLEGGEKLSAETFALTYLGNYQYSVHIEPANTNPFAAQRMENLAALAEVAKENPEIAEIDPKCFGDTPPAELLCRFILANGTLTSISPTDLFDVRLPTTLRWIFPNTFSGKYPWDQAISAVITLSLASLTAFSLKMSTFSGTAISEQKFSAPDGKTIDILVGNFCDENPLRWYTEPPSRLPADEDFKWYFQLLKPGIRNSLKNKLLGLALPIPHQLGFALGNGMNCLPAGYKAYLFTQ